MKRKDPISYGDIPNELGIDFLRKSIFEVSIKNIEKMRSVNDDYPYINRYLSPSKKKLLGIKVNKLIERYVIKIPADLKVDTEKLKLRKKDSKVDLNQIPQKIKSISNSDLLSSIFNITGAMGDDTPTSPRIPSSDMSFGEWQQRHQSGLPYTFINTSGDETYVIPDDSD